MAAASETQLSIVLKLIDDASNELKAAQTAFKQFGDGAAQSISTAASSMEGSFNATEEAAIRAAEQSVQAWTTGAEEARTAVAQSFDEMAVMAQYAAATAGQAFAAESQSIQELNAMLAEADVELNTVADAEEKVATSGSHSNRTFGQAIQTTAEYYGAFLLLNDAITAFNDVFDAAFTDALAQSPQLADEWQDIKDKWDAAMETLGTELTPAIEEFFNIVEAAMPAVLAFFDGLAAVLQTIELPLRIIIDGAQELGYLLGGDLADASAKANDVWKAVGDTISNVGKDFSQAATTATTGFDSMAAATTQDLKKVATTASSTADTVAASIQRIQQQMSDAQDALTGNIGDASTQEATAIVAQEQKIADLKTQIQTAQLKERSDAQKTVSAETIWNDQKSVESLEASLATEQAAYDKYAQLRVDLASQVTEAERRANETAFERHIEDIQNTEIQQVDSFTKQMARLQQEMAQEDAKAANATKNEQAITAAVDTETKKQTDMVNTQVDAQIQKYNQLRAAVDGSYGSGSVRPFAGSVLPFGGFSVSTPPVIASVHDAVITPSGIIKTDPADYLFATKNPASIGGGGINVTISGNTISSQLDLRNMAQAVSAEIVRVLRVNQKVSI